MKKILLLSLALLSTLSFYSCKDDDMSIPEGASDRLFRPMFRNDNSTGKGENDPYNTVITDYNTANLYWYVVDDAVGYEIMWTKVKMAGSSLSTMRKANHWRAMS